MPTQSTVEIEFAPCDTGLQAACQTMAELVEQLDVDCFHVVPLVRIHGCLVEPWSTLEDAPSSYAYRIHFAPMTAPDLDRIRASFLAPLAATGIVVREYPTVH